VCSFAKFHYAEGRYAEYHIMMSVVMLSAILQITIRMSVVILNII
jgi:hypothetical protein